MDVKFVEALASSKCMPCLEFISQIVISILSGYAVIPFLPRKFVR